MTTTYTPGQTAQWTAADWASLVGETVEVVTEFSYGPVVVAEVTLSANDRVTIRNSEGGGLNFTTYFGVTVIVGAP